MSTYPLEIIELTTCKVFGKGRSYTFDSFHTKILYLIVFEMHKPYNLKRNIKGYYFFVHRNIYRINIIDNITLMVLY